MRTEEFTQPVKIRQRNQGERAQGKPERRYGATEFEDTTRQCEHGNETGRRSMQLLEDKDGPTAPHADRRADLETAWVDDAT